MVQLSKEEKRAGGNVKGHQGGGRSERDDR